MPNVLVLVAEKTSSLIVAIAQAGYQVMEVGSSGEALQETLRRALDVMIVPDDADPVDGADLLPLLRQITSATIVVVGEGGENRMARALFQGADAYWTHPVDTGEVSSRLRALLRRRHSRRPTNGGRRLLSLAQERALQTNLSGLSPVESRLFGVFLKRGGGVIPTRQLVADVWGDGGKESSLRFYIRRLRLKLEPSGFLRILNSKGIGYRLEVQHQGLEQR